MPRIHAVSSKPSIQSFAATPCGKIIEPVIVVQIVKNLVQHEPSHPMIQQGHPMLCFPKERVGSWMKFIFPMPNSDPVQTLQSCLVLSKTGIQETGAAHVTSQTSIKESCADTLSMSPSPSVLFHTKNHSYDREEVECYSCQFFVWRSSVKSGLQSGYKNGASLRPR